MLGGPAALRDDPPAPRVAPVSCLPDGGIVSKWHRILHDPEAG